MAFTYWSKDEVTGRWSQREVCPPPPPCPSVEETAELIDAAEARILEFAAAYTAEHLRVLHDQRIHELEEQIESDEAASPPGRSVTFRGTGDEDEFGCPRGELVSDDE